MSLPRRSGRRSKGAFQWIAVPTHLLKPPVGALDVSAVCRAWMLRSAGKAHHADAKYELGEPAANGGGGGHAAAV